MHLRISLAANDSIRLPVHYNRLVQAVIYNSITPELSAFLHDCGFPFEKRTFKMFTFSRLQGRAVFDRHKGELLFPRGLLTLVISSPLDIFCKELGNILLLSNQVRLGDQVLYVTEITVTQPRVMGSRCDFKLLSPAVVYSTFTKFNGKKYTCYFEPGEKDFAEQIDANLRKKYYSLYQEHPPAEAVRVVPRGKVRRSIVKYKEFYVKGYTCRLEMEGPRELLQLALDAGVGSKNSQGFGCVELVN